MHECESRKRRGERPFTIPFSVNPSERVGTWYVALQAILLLLCCAAAVECNANKVGNGIQIPIKPLCPRGGGWLGWNLRALLAMHAGFARIYTKDLLETLTLLALTEQKIKEKDRERDRDVTCLVRIATTT